MSSITPSIGRKVWYHPTLAEIESVMGVNDLTQALDATVIFVTDPDHVSLAITDHAGTPHVRHGVLLADEIVRGDSGMATWMPYQRLQVAKPPEMPTAPMETKVCTDGTSATGPGPLPDLSPAQQDAAAMNQAQSQEAPAASAV